MSAPSKTIAVAADDAAFELKGKIVDYLKSKGIPVEDYGVNQPDPSVLYPDVALTVAQAVAAGKHDRGILMCGTGIGMAIAADKVPGVRAANAFDDTTARLCREHNNANILTLGARIVEDSRAIEIVRTFLATEFAGGRHQRRIDKISEMDQAYCPGATLKNAAKS